jgi:PhzF family phenazine biosynthesis protein
MRRYSFKQVDVFADKPFWGNPVAVVLGATDLTEAEMQKIAAWTNLSETTFVLPPTTKEADYRLRIFTPRQELPFAGHPTIGSAHAAIEGGVVSAKNGRLRQECLAGILDLRAEEKDGRLRIWVQGPAAAVTPIDSPAKDSLRRALGSGFVEETPPLRVDVGAVWLVVNMGQAEKVASLSPDMNAVVEISNRLKTSGIAVFGRSTDGISALQVRAFAPAQGIAEDPVCGSGNISVATFLFHSGLLREFGSEYTARQGMQVGRDGKVFIRVSEDGSVELGGYAITCVDGNLQMS